MNPRVTEHNVGQSQTLSCKPGYIPSQEEPVEVSCQYDDLKGSFWRYEGGTAADTRAECIEGVCIVNQQRNIKIFKSANISRLPV